MFDINFKTDDGTEYELMIDATYYGANCDDPGMEMEIEKISPVPTDIHYTEIINAWHYHEEIYGNAADMAYLEREEI